MLWMKINLYKVNDFFLTVPNSPKHIIFVEDLLITPKRKIMKIAIIGAGNMGGATARGLAKGTLIPTSDIYVSNPSTPKLDAKAETPPKRIPIIICFFTYDNFFIMVCLCLRT